MLLLLLGDALQKLRRFKSDRDEIWQDCSSSNCALCGIVGFLIWLHTFKMAAMTSAHRSLLHIQQRSPAARYLAERVSTVPDK